MPSSYIAGREAYAGLMGGLMGRQPLHYGMSVDDSAPSVGIDHLTVVPRNAPQAQGGEDQEDAEADECECNCDCGQ